MVVHMAFELPDLERERAKLHAWVGLVKSGWRYLGFALMGVAMGLAIHPELPADFPFVLPASRAFWIVVALAGFLMSSVALAAKVVRDAAVIRTEDSLAFMGALTAAWPLSQSVVVYRICAPRVTTSGDVIVNLRAVNYSPFPVTLHSPAFIPVLGGTGADPVSVRAQPVQALLESSSGYVDIEVLGRFARMELTQHGDHTFGYIFMRGHVTATREIDNAEAKIRLQNDEGRGDSAELIEVS